MGLEPTTPGTTIRCSNQLSYNHHINLQADCPQPFFTKVCKDIFLNAIIASHAAKNSIGVLRIFRSMAAPAQHILILPKWYPNPHDLQNGSFIKHFALKMSEKHAVTVVFAFPARSTNHTIQVRETGKLLEILVPYVQNKSSLLLLRKALNYRQYMNALEIGVAEMLQNRAKPNLIHVHVLIRPALYANKLSKQWQIPWVLTEHSSDFLSHNFVHHSPIKKWVIKSICRKSNGISAVSGKLAAGMVTMGVQNKIQVIPNLIDFPAALSSLPHNSMQIATAADLVDAVKNISGVLKALASIAPKLGNFQYHIIGDGPDRASLEQLTRTLGLEKRVVFHGRQEHAFVLKFLPGIDFLVTNSRSETFSLITAEAVSFGKPVIVTRCGGPEEWFKPEYGLMIPLDDQQELSNALLKMASGFRAFSSQRMSNEIKAQFAPEKIMAQYEELYQHAGLK
jgi:glycosyltransferase involved in cell wall biosynthesis